MIKSGMSKIRKSLVDGLIRPVRAARDDSPQIDESSDYSSSGSDDTRDSDSASGSDSESSASGTNKKATPDFTNVSFGELVRAQDALANLKRKRRVDEDGDDGRLDGRSKRGPGADGSIHRAATGSSSRGERGAAATASRSTRAKSVTTSISSKDDNGPEEEGAVERPAKLSRRARKSAPEEMSSKVRVSVRRKVVSEDATARARRLMLSRIDPRFDPLIVGGGPNEEKNRGKAKRDAERARRDYAFIDELRASEMAALRERVVKTRNAEEKAALKRELAVLESRARERERRLAAERVLEEHKKREKELAKKGKRPFYLKRSEQKKKVLIEQFATMNEKQRDKLIEKKRKKLAAKEKKMEPPAKRRT